LREAWQLARERVADQYGQMTIGELLARFEPPGGTRAN
jgi:hypothetical protein